ncbi:MAG: tRNA (adenosine(37)-N6)-dimethylallyltransferase MiaA [Steroidobacteraceae bacterium]|jgi:tRNA dimethylallyltransferase
MDAILLCGPTASGKSDWALALAERWPVEIISVDATQVYRGFDIGSAKPDKTLQARIPHHLLDLRDPQQSYSAGEFVADALAAIAAVRGRGAVPLLVGGTMLYFNALVRGLARLPSADPQLRAAIDARAARSGWAALHAELQAIDPEAAARIHPNDPQRIQRALEVFELSGRTITAWQRDTRPEHGLRWSRWALVPADRAVLHARIAQRYARMLEAGLLAEVRQLLALPGIHRESPAMRAVGYRQLAAHLSGECSLNEAVDRAVAATRQLAKRQLTWINADPGWQKVDPFQPRAWEAWVATLQTDFQTVPGAGQR